MIKKVVRLNLITFFFILSFNTYCFGFETFKNVNGVDGLVTMPTASSSIDGDFSFSSAKYGKNLKNTLSFQALPRLNFSFRYSGVGDKQIGFYKSGYSYWDRSFDVRVDLLKENKVLPDITIGLQDFIGTGLYSGEYLVASKTLFQKIRLTAGLGTGRFASTNIIKSKGVRKTNSGGQFGGLFRSESLFTGPIGVFGGLEFQTPIKNLTFGAEYSSDDQSVDAEYLSSLPTSKLNFSTKFKISQNLNLAGYSVGGNEIGIQLNILSNPFNAYGGNFLEPPPQPFYSFPIPGENINEITKKIKENLKEEKIDFIGFKLEENSATTIIENFHYAAETQAIGRCLRIMSRHIPFSKETFIVVLSNYGVPTSKIAVNRNKVAELIDAPNAELLSLKITDINDAPKVISNAQYMKQTKDKFFWSVSPYYKLHLFDPDKPLYYDLGPRLKFKYDLRQSLFLEGTIERSLFSTFNEVRRGVKGNLPKVRTDLRNYLIKTDSARINDLYLSSYYKGSKNIYGRFTLGYLEPMYAGLSSELIYLPVKSKFSIGAEINTVRPRDFDQLFDLRSVNDIPKTNGHMSLYIDTGYYYYDAQVDYGYYLAGDKGYTLTLTRKFPNNWKAGGFFSLTDASFSDFGEGSFDKGFFFSIPLNSAIPYETKDSITELVRPIQGDGGQKLSIPGRLYEILSNSKKQKLVNSWPKIWQ